MIAGEECPSHRAKVTTASPASGMIFEVAPELLGNRGGHVDSGSIPPSLLADLVASAESTEDVLIRALRS
ncbi:hypothetical protein AQJ67_32685 [Streptomyces caeruleatus]|uniref:Uncharacterized protein n=1 Tax=Streptomyces caeruleatus TaxID=661399 RepID=A0A101TR51_9ACTN|nr:hypothetical protein AQJ67_32685 [Streptomyces caeruleatus]